MSRMIHQNHLMRGITLKSINKNKGFLLILILTMAFSCEKKPVEYGDNENKDQCTKKKSIILPQWNEKNEIPSNPHEAITYLMKNLDKETVDSVGECPNEEDATTLTGHNLGLWIRNKWKLWEGSPLLSYFRERGIDNPDVISYLIVKWLWREIKGIGYDINSDIEDARRKYPQKLDSHIEKVYVRKATKPLNSDEILGSILEIVPELDICLNFQLLGKVPIKNEYKLSFHCCKNKKLTPIAYTRYDEKCLAEHISSKVNISQTSLKKNGTLEVNIKTKKGAPVVSPK